MTFNVRVTLQRAQHYRLSFRLGGIRDVIIDKTKSIKMQKKKKKKGRKKRTRKVYVF